MSLFVCKNTTVISSVLCSYWAHWTFQVLLCLRMYILDFQAVGVSNYFKYLLVQHFFAVVLYTTVVLDSRCFCAVSGGLVSLVQGSYEYYHYLQDGFDDSVMEFFFSSLTSSFRETFADLVLCSYWSIMFHLGLGMCLPLSTNYHLMVQTPTLHIYWCSFTQV